MKKLTITLFAIASLSFLLISCSGGKQNAQNTLTEEEVKEVQHLDSISAEIESSLEELEATEAELMEALEDIQE